jgi:hypothetical protein
MIFIFLFTGVIAGGALLALIIYWRTDRQPYLSRVIDLISFSLTGIGLIGSVFFVENFVSRLRHDADRLTQINQSLTIARDIGERIVTACEKDEIAKDETSQKECANLFAVFRSNAELDYNQIPQLDSIRQPVTSAHLIQLAHEINEQIKAINSSNAKFKEDEFKRSLSTADFSQFTWVYIASCSLCFAFGMGLVRRIVDLRTDWKKKLP